MIALAFSSLTGIITGLFFYFKNNHNLILDKELLDIVATYNKINEDFYGTLNKEELASKAINGMMSSLDEEYTTHMDKEDTSDLSEKLEGKYHGVGITVQKKDNNIVVVNVIEETPAFIAGVKSGDIIKKVNEREITEDDTLDEVSSLIKERDKVILTILRESETLTLEIDVKTIEYPSIESKMFERNNKKVGYIYLSTFSKTSASQVRKSLSKLESEGMESLIIDVRSNTGGYLESADAILNMFIKKGEVLYSIENSYWNNDLWKRFSATN